MADAIHNTENPAVAYADSPVNKVPSGERISHAGSDFLFPVGSHYHSLLNDAWNWEDYSVDLSYEWVNNGGAIYYGDYLFKTWLQSNSVNGTDAISYFDAYVGGNNFSTNYTEMGFESQGGNTGTIWYFLSKNGVNCTRGNIFRRNPTTGVATGCIGNPGDLSLTGPSNVYMELGFYDGSWAVFIEGPDGISHEVGTVDNTNEVIYLPELTVAEEWNPSIFPNGNPWIWINSGFIDPSYALNFGEQVKIWPATVPLSWDWTPNNATVASKDGNGGCPNQYCFVGKGLVNNGDQSAWGVNTQPIPPGWQPYSFCSGTVW